MKKIFLALISFFIIITCAAQKRNVGYFGAGLSLLFPENEHQSASVFPAITLTPGVKFFQGKNFAMVLNAPVSVGWRFKSHGYLGVDLPVMLNMHFGSTAANNERSKWGVILGAGVGYVSVFNDDDFVLNKANYTEFWGYRFQLGVQFNDKKDPEFKPMIMLTYGRSIAANWGSMIGIGIHFIYDPNQDKSSNGSKNISPTTVSPF